VKPRRASWRAWTALGLLGLLGAGLSACLGLEDQPERARTEYGPFAEEVFTIWDRELALSLPPSLAPARQERLRSQRDDILWALARVPEGPVGQKPGGIMDLIATPEMQELWGSGEVEALGAAGAAASAALHGPGSPALPALARILDAHGGQDPDALWALLYEVLGPDGPPLVQGLDRVLRHSRVRVEALHDAAGAALRDLDEAEPTSSYHGPDFDRWLLASGCRSLDLELPAGMGGSPLRGALATRCRAELAALAARPAYGVRVDERGFPRVLPGPAGTLPPPFFDGDGDGSADTDSAGRRLRSDGSVIDVPAFANPVPAAESPEVARDAWGRARVPATTQDLYDYTDLKRSLLGLGAWHLDWALAPQEAGAPPVAERLLDLLGPAFGAAAASDPALLDDLAHGVAELARYPRLGHLLAALGDLLLRRPDLFEALAVELGKVAHLEAETPPLRELLVGSNLLDHLLGDNPLRALDEGVACDPALGAEACANPSWLECRPEDALGPRCRVRHELAGLPGPLEQISDTGLLRGMLRVAATEPRVAGLIPAVAQMLEYSGTDITGLGDLVDAGLCPDYRGLPPSDLLERPWRRPHDPAVACEYLPYAPLEGWGPDGCSALQKAFALIYNTDRLVWDPDMSRLTCDPTLAELVRELQQDLSRAGILQIDNVAAFYLDSLVGNARMQSRLLVDEILDTGLMRRIVGYLVCELEQDEVDGDVLRVDARQLNLWVLRDHGSVGEAAAGECTKDLGNALDHEQLELRHHDADMLLCVGTPVPGLGQGDCDPRRGSCSASFGEALAPLLELFSFDGRERELQRPRGMQEPAGRTQLLADLTATFHIHWGSLPRAASCPLRGDGPAGEGSECRYHWDELRQHWIYAFNRQEGTGLERWEPWLLALLRETALVQRALELLAEGERGCDAPGQTGPCLNGELGALFAWLLDRDAYGAQWRFPSEPAQVAPSGVLRGDRRTRDPRPARIYLLLEPLRRWIERVDRPEHAAARAALDALTPLADLLEVGPDGRLLRPYSVHLLRELLVLAAEEAVERDVDGFGREEWLEDIDDLEDVLESALASAPLAELVGLWGELDAEDRTWAFDLARHLLVDGAGEGEDRLGPSLRALGHMAHLDLPWSVWRDLGRGLGEVLRPEGRPALRLLEGLAPFERLDPREQFSYLAANLLRLDRSEPASRAAVEVLGDALSQTLRAEPAARTPLEAADLVELLRRAETFLLDPVNGLPRAGAIVRQRLSGRAEDASEASP